MYWISEGKMGKSAVSSTSISIEYMECEEKAVEDCH